MDPWEHPDWYDLHDTNSTAGAEREPEHYRELVVALPPLDHADHLIDIGAGTGKLAAMIAHSYSSLGRITLVEPNQAKLERALARVVLPHGQVQGLAQPVGAGQALPGGASLITVGSVLMPLLIHRSWTLDEGMQWISSALLEIYAALSSGGNLWLLETLATSWTGGAPGDPARRLHYRELEALVSQAGFVRLECVYRFRDRVVLTALKL